jgi:hypothetical protein
MTVIAMVATMRSMVAMAKMAVTLMTMVMVIATMTVALTMAVIVMASVLATAMAMVMMVTLAVVTLIVMVMATPRARLTALEWAAESEMMDEMMLVAEMGHGTRTWRNESKAMTRAMWRTTVVLMVM